MSPRKRKKEAIHILVVDDQREITDLLRNTLEAAEQGYEVVCVPSGEEALLEVQRQSFPLVVVDYRLPGMTGLELIGRLQRGSETTRFLLITGYEIEEMESALAGLDVVEVLGKPIDLEAFITAVERAITGEPKPSAAQVKEFFDTTPEIDEGPMLDYISALQIDLGASAVLLADRMGVIRLEKGTVGSLDIGSLGMALAESFNASIAVVGYIGYGAPSIVHYYDGTDHDVYTLAVGEHFFIIVVFPGGTPTKLGPVVSYGRRTVVNILDTLGVEAPEVIEVMEEIEEEFEAEPLVEEAELEPLVEEAEVEAELEEVVEYAEELVEEYDEEGEPLDLQGVEIDLDTLEEIDSMFDVEDEGVDEETLNEIGEMFDTVNSEELEDADAYWDEATREETAAADGTLSREEAIKRGLISDDLSSTE
jgi:CheY-like chemotaxis protein